MRISARSVAAFGAIGLALGNVGRIPGGSLGGRNAPVVVADLALALAWLFVAMVVLRRRRVEVPAMVTPALGFILVATLSTALAVSRYHLPAAEAIGVASFLLRWIGYFGWFLFVRWCLTERESGEAWGFVELALLSFAAFGIVQSLLVPGFAQKVHGATSGLTWDIQGRRLVSTVLDPNFAGALVTIALLHRLARVAEGLRESRLALAVLTAALLLTVSRSSVLALVVGTGVIVAIRGLRVRLLQLFVAGVLLVLPFATVLLGFAQSFNKLRFDASAAQRFIPWGRALVLVREHPVLGVGFNAIRPAQAAHGWTPIGGADVSLDGGLLFVAAMTGLVGLALYLLLLKRVIAAARRTWRDEGACAPDRAHAIGTAAATVAIVVHSLFVNSLLLPFVMQVLWIMWGRLSHIRASRLARAAAPLVTLVALPLLLAGCDPCSGIAACVGDARITLTGSIVEPFTGRPVPGVRIEARTGSGAAGSAGASTTTDAEGLWTLSLGADSGAARVSVTVAAPGREPYVVSNLPVGASRIRGDAVVLGAWTSSPFASFQASVIRRGTPLPGAVVSFTRTGGASTDGASALQASANGAGIFEFDLLGRQVGDVIGDLVVTHPSLARPSVLPGFRIPLEYRFRVPSPRAAIPVGGQLSYGGQVYDRGTRSGSPGAFVEFTRTGGIATSQATVSTTAGPTGFFRLDLDPAGYGEVTGTLSIRPVGRAPVSFPNVRLAVYDSTEIRSLGLFAVGQGWNWAIELWRHDSLVPAKGVPVTFRHTGGVATNPAAFSTVTGSDGRVELRLPVSDTGTVDGELVVTPAPGQSYTIRGLRLRTNADDDLHYGGLYGFGPALRYVGEVLSAGDLPVVGATVEWRQLSGPPATPNPLLSTTRADGRFPVTLYPSTAGTVVGEVRIRPPAPWPPGTEFTYSLRLDSFETGDLRLAAVFRIPPP